MAKIFWIKCPKCEKDFYASLIDFRNQDRKLMCPFCQERFLDKEAKEIIDVDNN
jgi:DNA-directed RNA polymerase subunit RPC12/RpoP